MNTPEIENAVRDITAVDYHQYLRCVKIVCTSKEFAEILSSAFSKHKEDATLSIKMNKKEAVVSCGFDAKRLESRRTDLSKTQHKNLQELSYEEGEDIPNKISIEYGDYPMTRRVSGEIEINDISVSGF